MRKAERFDLRQQQGAQLRPAKSAGAQEIRQRKLVDDQWLLLPALIGMQHLPEVILPSMCIGQCRTRADR